MFGKHDITFCSDKDCKRTDCERHPSHTPKGVPVSIFLATPKKGEECEMYWPGWTKPDGRKVKK
jgi:hypothetical protein